MTKGYIDSQNPEERIAGMVGIKCMRCLDTGQVQTWEDGRWKTVTRRETVNDSNGKPVLVIQRCDCGKDYGY